MGRRIRQFTHSVSGRLVLTAVAIEITLLSLLIGNNLRRFDVTINDQIHTEVQQMHPVLRAALVAPLAQQDMATVQSILDEVVRRHQSNIAYLVVLDARGRRIAQAGLPRDSALPALSADPTLHLSGDGQDLFNTATPLHYMGSALGSLRMGIDLRTLVLERQRTIRQSLGIAAIEVLLSSLMLLATGLWIGRGLRQLDTAAQALSEGRFERVPEPRRDDDVARLSRSFNRMLEQVQGSLTQLQQKNAELDILANYDALTHLPSRRLLRAQLDQALRDADALGGIVVIAFLDLDGFKAINDRFGHGAGDALLIEVARRLRQSVRDDDLVARLAGDEFIVVGHLKQQQHCDDLMRRILDNLAQPYALHEISLPGLTASIGVVRYPEVRCDADTLLRHADQTMYAAKRAGRNRWLVLDSRQLINEESRQHLAQELRHALEAGQLCMHYQPKVHLGSGEVFAAEALLRWQHPTRGVLAPGDFLFAFDGSVDDEVALSRWVIEENLRQIDAFVAAGRPLRLAVNLPAAHLLHPHFLDDLRALLDRHHPQAAQWLNLEILESAALGPLDEVVRRMTVCAGWDIGFAIDDFGAGYASLSYLKRIPSASLKIDQDFVRSMLVDSGDYAIVSAVIQLGAAFGERVIAEGVETVEIGEELLHMGCAYGQGYGIARPMSLDALPTWIAQWTPPARWVAAFAAWQQGKNHREGTTPATTAQ